MQVFVGGMPAGALSSTAVWQYRQSSPMPPTWCLWLKGTGCVRATKASVTYAERLISCTTQPSAATKNTNPKMLTFEIVFVLR